MNMRKSVVWFLFLLPMTGMYSHAQKTDIGAIGRITPQNGVVWVTCPAGDLIESIAVTVGDKVTKGKPLVHLKADENARLNLDAARSAVKETNELGPLTIELQRLKKNGAEQDLKYAQQRLLRFKEIGGDSISTQQMEEREYRVQSAQIALDSARKELERIEMEQRHRQSHTQHDMKVAELAMERFTVRAPIDGTVIDIPGKVGNRTDGSAVLQIADLSQMMVIAEVFEGDVKKISPGMKASITNNALSGKLTGKVLSIGPVIEREAKIAHVNIILDNPQEASRFVNMETNVVIYSK